MIKNSSYLVAFLASLEWLGFDPTTLAVYAGLMGIDFMTGVARVGMTEGWRSVTSNGARRGILSKALTLTALFSVGLMAKGVGFDASSIMQAVVTVFILAEGYSILGNIHSAIHGTAKMEFDAIAWLLGWVRELINKVVK